MKDKLKWSSFKYFDLHGYSDVLCVFELGQAVNIIQKHQEPHFKSWEK